ncbi:MAG: TetR/AcrR family transcriptional regulator [Chloroflexi bacterium]|nr:TetR/AcrR family transcriptional regulator [Chloroflexota bacterium]
MATTPQAPTSADPAPDADLPVVAPPAPRRLDRDARRAQLIAAATRVFARHGYAAVDVAAIVAEARVTRGTFYLYFPTKRDVFLAAIDQYLEVIQRQRRLALPGAGRGLRAQLAEAFAATLRFQAEHRDLALVALRDGWGADPEATERLRVAGVAAKAGLAATYERLIAAGRLRACDTHLAATAVGGMLREVLLHEVLIGGRVDAIDAIAAELADLVAGGLRPRR